MPTEPNSYAPPAADESGAQRRIAPPAKPPLDLFTLTQPGGTTWTLSIHPEIIRLMPADGRPARQLDHHDFAAQATFTFFGNKSSLVLLAPSPALVLPLSPEALAALREWDEARRNRSRSKATRSRRPEAARSSE